MHFETKLSCGDKVWYLSNLTPVQITVGRVEVRFTKTKGLQRGERFVGSILTSENTLPKSDNYEERYMCVETGVGSGSIHELGKSIFITKEDCLAGHDEYLKQRAEADRQSAIRARDYALRRKAEAEAELEKLSQKLGAEFAA